MKLTEINEEFQAIYNLASDTDDVETLTELFNQLESELSHKADSIRVILSKLKSDGEYLADEVKRLQLRKKSIDTNIENLKGLLMWTFVKAGINKLKTPKATFSLANSKSLKIDNGIDISSLPKECYTVEYKANKRALKEAMESGVVLDGVSIEESTSLRIR